MISRLEGGPARPRDRVLIAAASGVRGRPTVVNNVETLAHVALIARYGARWFRSVGSADDPGTRLVSLSGAVRRPGVFEVDTGIALTELIGRYGQRRSTTRAGIVDRWLPRLLGRPAVPGPGDLSRASLGRCGATPGPGWSMSSAPTNAAWRGPPIAWPTWRRRAPANAGRASTACRGWRGCSTTSPTAAVVPVLVERIRQTVGLVDGRGSCRHPDGTARLVRSALDVFAGDIALHSRRPLRSRTPMTRHRTPIRLHIDWTRCDGRGLCAELLPGVSDTR